jgi:short-subunit dehydrogenase
MRPWALITGASRGLGSELAQRFWESGYQLLLVSRSLESLEVIREKLHPTSKQKCQIFACDLGSSEELSGFLAKIERLDLVIRVLINNAAIQGPIGEFIENDLQQWEESLDVNLIAPIKLSQFVGKQMKARQQGNIIQLSGGGATGPRPNFSAYATAKAGLVRFSETLAEELRPYRVNVNCIAPGPMPTNMLKQVVVAGPTNAGEPEYMKAQQLFVDESQSMQYATDLALFLASDQGRNITGKLISALWDNWSDWPRHSDELNQSDIYTLRRITGRDRGMNWGDK